MAWMVILDWLYGLLTSLRFWIGVTIATSIVPMVWSWVQQQQQQQVIVVGQPPQQQIDVTPIMNMMMLVMMVMLPLVLARVLMR